MKLKPEISDKPSTHSPFYRLHLFVAGNEPNSVLAKAVIACIFENYLRNQAEIQVIDVFENYQAASEYQVIAVPMLFVESPLPRRMLAGSLNDETQVLAVLGLTSQGGDDES